MAIKQSIEQPSASVAAIVVTYNRLTLLKECLDALRSQTYPLTAVYVVDNASTDGTQQWFEQSEYSNDDRFEFAQIGSNVGGAGGFEFGIREAMKQSFDWLWLMDDDSIAESDALALLMHRPESTDPVVGVLASKVVGVDGKLVEMNRPGHFNWQTAHTQKVSVQDFDKEVVDVDGTSFVGFLVRSAVVKKVGLPRSNFFIHFDDHEYSLRIRRAGFAIKVISGSLIVHKLTQMMLPQQSSKFVLINEMWKYYYGQRNEVWGLIRLVHPWPWKVIFIFRRLVWASKRTIKYMKADHAMLRIRLEWQAIFDGLASRMGKRIDPIEFKHKL